MRHDIFDMDYVAKIKIPEKEQDLKEKVDSLTNILADMKIKNDKKEEELAKKKLQKMMQQLIHSKGLHFFKMMKKN